MSYTAQHVALPHAACEGGQSSALAPSANKQTLPLKKHMTIRFDNRIKSTSIERDACAE
jgi:hypothetical protein